MRIFMEEEIESSAVDPGDLVFTKDNKVVEYRKLQGGRAVFTPYAGEPRGTANAGFLLKDFLAEKLPIKILNQAVAFFRLVMNNPQTSGAEAFIQIWKNKNHEAFLYVPEQTVSSAHVGMKFNTDEINKMTLSGNYLLGDIHSHNSMGAFFSSTDDEDDAKKFGIAGVIGKLTSDSFDGKWRFCFGKTRFADIPVGDIFESMQNSEVVPEEWLNKVKTPTIAPCHTYGSFSGLGPVAAASKGPHSAGKTDRKHETYYPHSLGKGSKDFIITDSVSGGKKKTYFGGRR